MTSALPITPLLALCRVDYLDSSMLCTNAAVALSLRRNGDALSPELCSNFRTFLPKLLGVERLSDATPENILHVSLLALGPSLRSSGYVPESEAVVQTYIDAICEIDLNVHSLCQGQHVSEEQLAKLETFCRLLSSQMTSAVEQSLREVQPLPL